MCPFYPQGVSYSSPPCPDNPQGGAELVNGDELDPLPYRFDSTLLSRFADELMLQVRKCAQFLTGELIAMDMHGLLSTEVYRAVIARDRKERN